MLHSLDVNAFKMAISTFRMFTRIYNIGDIKQTNLWNKQHAMLCKKA